MVRSQSDQRQMLLARAERVQAGLSERFVAPLSRQIAELQAELLLLSHPLEAPALENPVPANGGMPAQRAALREAPVVFVHIPKTAGTTATFWLKLLHGDRHVKLPSYTTDRSVESLTAKLRRAPGTVDTAAGHVPYSKALFPERSSFFTFLRDPIARALSHFCYFSLRDQKRREPLSQAGPTQAEALKAALAAWDPASPASQALLPDNLQTRLVSGFDMRAPSSREMLEAASRNLAEFDAVGLVERFDESTVLLHRVYGWPLLALQSHRVKTHRRLSVDELEPHVLEGLRKLNALDEELYAEAAQRFEAAIARFDPTFSADVQALRLARQLEMARSNGQSMPADGEVEPRAAAILAHTAEAFDNNPPLKAERLLENLLSLTRQLHGAALERVHEVTSLAREFRQLMERVL